MTAGFSSGWKVALAGLVAAGFMVAAGSTMAAPTLRLTTGGGASTTVVDEGLGDSASGVAGVVTFSGTLGVFEVQTTIGDITTGSNTQPTLKMSNTTIDVLGPTSDTLIIEFSDVGFTGGGPTSAITDVGGSDSGGMVLSSFEAYIDSSNTLFGAPASGQVAAIGPLSGNPFSGLDSGSVNLGAGPVNYSVTQIARISGAPGSNISFDATTRVPVPATLGLLGIGLIGMGALARRRRV